MICLKFQRQEQTIKDVTVRINQTERAQEKVRFAEELQKETDTLLSCQEYDTKRLDCESCRFIANLRKRTADLIIKAEKLV